MKHYYHPESDSLFMAENCDDPMAEELTEKEYWDKKVEFINREIAELPDKSDINDGYHTFGELYAHRCALFILLLNQFQFNIDIGEEFGTGFPYEVWKSKVNADGSVWGDWFVAGIDDKVTYHLPIKLWDRLTIPEIERGLWDGHSSKDVLERLFSL